ncbi:MAG: DUF4276 family protein [Myxococcales bacterium]|nr:DUF4276 family protein [Myxococcales bacterium]
MTTLVLLLEEPSAKALLEGVLPRMLPRDVSVLYLHFEGKQDLEKNIVGKLRAWRTPDTQFVILRDQDAGDCQNVKARLLAKVTESKRTALVRVACRELEAWVVGDLAAVAKAFERPEVSKQATKEKFRDPDALGNPAQELRALVPEYQKVDGARRVGRLLDPSRNASRSFKAFCDGLKKLFPDPTGER